MADSPHDGLNGGIKGDNPQPKSYSLLGDGRTSPMERIRVRMAADGYNALNNNNVTDTETDEDYRPFEPRKGDNNEETWTRTEKQLCIVVIISVIVIVLLSALVFLFHFQIDLKDSKCLTPDCVMLAGDMIEKMDNTVDPCDDFYQFACGKEIQSPFIPPTAYKWGAFAQVRSKISIMTKRILEEPGFEYLGTESTAVQKTKTYYHSCMNMTATEDLGNRPMQMLIKAIGSWPLISDDIMGTWNEGSWQLETNLAKASYFGGGGLFDFGVGTDYVNSSLNILTIDQGGLTFPNHNSYLGNQSEKYRSIYLDYFEGITTLLGASKADSKQAAGELWEFESKLAEYFMKEEDRQDIWALYNKMTLYELQHRYFGNFNLSVYLRELFNKDIPLSELMIANSPSYFEKMTDLVQQTPKRVLANYLVWQTVIDYIGYMPESYRLVVDKVQQLMYGMVSQQPLWEQCVKRTKTMMPFVTGALYVERAFPENGKAEIEKIVDYIFKAFEESLPGVSWMDSTTKERALEKAKAINTKLVYPEFIKHPDQLDEYYAKLEFVENEQFHNKLAGVIYSSDKALAKRGQPADKTRWSMGPDEVNAYYSPPLNQIVFPAAIFQDPFYDPIFPMAVTFGAIGSIIGHELTHGFDNKGSQFDKYGNLFNWWTNSSRQSFNEKTKCLVDQYNNYPVGDKHINGITTLNENIADNGGVKTAFKAYMDWLDDHDWNDPRVDLPGLDMSKRQLFFLGYAQVWCAYYTPEYALQSLVLDVHPYAKYRVIGPLSNFDEFSNAFECKYGAMNPAKKCVVW